MKKLMIMAILTITFLSGCSGITTRAKIEVNDNVFYSSMHPKIKLEIDKKFQYIGNAKGLGSASGTDLTTSYGGNMFTFINSSDHINIKSGIILHKEVIHQGYWDSNIYKNYKPKIKSGNLKINNKKYKSIIFVHSLNLYEFADNGYAPIEKAIFRSIGRIVDPRNKILFHIIYFENILLANDNLKDSAYVNPSYLNDTQQRAINDFITRADNAFKVIPEE